MLGYKARIFKVHAEVSLEDLVPEDNFYRHVDATLDLSFVRDLVRDCYSSSMGRPSIDPVVFFKLQLIMFFEGIRSERQLMETASLNLAHRWFIGYDLDEPVPDLSTNSAAGMLPLTNVWSSKSRTTSRKPVAVGLLVKSSREIVVLILARSLSGPSLNRNVSLLSLAKTPSVASQPP